MADERAKAIDFADKQFGKGSIMRLGSKEAIVPIAVIPTGAISFDEQAIGVGGFPRGRVVEVFGPESSGKTTITLQVIAEAQKIREGWLPLSTPNTRSILATPKSLVLTWTTFWCRSRTTASRRLRSPRRGALGALLLLMPLVACEVKP